MSSRNFPPLQTHSLEQSKFSLQIKIHYFICVTVASGVQAKFNAGSFVQRKIVALVTAAGLKRNASLRILNGLVEASAPPGLKAKLKARLKVMLLNPVCAVGDKLVWSKVKNGFGGNQKVIISGGSALSEGLER